MPCTQIIPWGADPDRFRHGDACAWRERLRIAPGQRVVLGLGRLVEKKGFAYLVEAFAQVRDGVLVIAGDGPQRTALAKPWVRLAGPVSWREVPDLMAMADIVVVPSVRDRSGNQDGMPTVALEAMAAGKPVVASRLGGLPLVVEDGKTGLLVPPGDAHALAEAIQGLLDAPEVAAAMGGAGREQVERELNWENVARRYVEVYQAVLA
jgi:glycosyltransferase involved in cell wall biosynthesis